MALVQASEAKDSDADQAFFLSSYAVVFCGTPQKGFPNETLKAVVRGQPNEKFVRSLVQGADLQWNLSEGFDHCFRLPGAQAVSLYGTIPIHPKFGHLFMDWKTSSRVATAVPADAAIFTMPKEKGVSSHLPINATHFNMTRFGGKANFDYDKVAGVLRQLAEDGPETNRTPG
ncbi:hypothetical protein BO78DRAFT_395349 [Aspergillus sclerotiicarbonarius CBS 121057]|uniref:Uncharacterized protein n=1 Tax=Aspergillus sclerotiicarbonarius (strain CBS 121057 / IBT 28362) TaxID=1448318 RepID=A0A319EM68_ASPSB|nr:hypothetical protein BO78DRAFT_395349 [Aspergillus sclerotiicarbonarius CBS 121057]